jgi:hypothetical protein
MDELKTPHVFAVGTQARVVSDESLGIHNLNGFKYYVGHIATIERISTETLHTRYLLRFASGVAFWVYRSNLKEAD